VLHLDRISPMLGAGPVGRRGRVSLALLADHRGRVPCAASSGQSWPGAAVEIERSTMATLARASGMLGGITAAGARLELAPWSSTRPELGWSWAGAGAVLA
jgi:hypothetical protein